jgi:hypothetical protein
VLGLLRLANHSISGSTSARRWNSAAVSSRLVGAISAGSCSLMTAAGRCFTRNDQFRIWTEKEIAESQTPPIGDPPLHQMARPIVQHVAALTEGSRIFQTIVGGIVGSLSRCAIASTTRSSGTELPPQGRACGQDVHGDPARSPLVRRTSARPAGRQRRMARWGGHSAGTFHRNGRG